MVDELEEVEELLVALEELLVEFVDGGAGVVKEYQTSAVLVADRSIIASPGKESD